MLVKTNLAFDSEVKKKIKVQAYLQGKTMAELVRETLAKAFPIEQQNNYIKEIDNNEKLFS